MALQIRIDQTGLAPGTPGRSRTDGLDDGSEVTLTNTGAGTTTEFQLLWTPPGDATASSTLAPTVDPKVWTFTPSPGCYGSYLVELVENGGTSTEVRERRVLGVRTPNLGILIPALNERGDVRASLVSGTSDEKVDNNADDFDDAALGVLTFAGWWRAIHELAIRLDAIGATPEPPEPASITGSTTGEQIDSIVAALVAHGLATDDRPPP